jgi:MFS family permease
LQLIFIRIFGGIGSTMCMSMVGPSSADYTLNRDRGKAMAVGGLFNGGGAVFTLLVFLKVPQWITDTTSLDVYQAGIITFTMISMLSLFAAFGSIFFIHDGAIFLQEKQPTTHSEDRTRLLVLRDTSSPSTPTELGDQFELEDGDEILKQAVEIPEEPEEQEKGCFGVLVDGITSGRDPIVLLSYCASFIGRGDATIITTFIAIWVSQEVLAAGGSQTEALSQAGLVTGITQTFALVTGPIFGVLVDRVNRVVILALVAIISFIGYTSIYLLTSVTSGWVYLSIMLIGAGEGGAFLVGQTLVTQGMFCM